MSKRPPSPQAPQKETHAHITSHHRSDGCVLDEMDRNAILGKCWALMETSPNDDERIMLLTALCLALLQLEHGNLHFKHVKSACCGSPPAAPRAQSEEEELRALQKDQLALISAGTVGEEHQHFPEHLTSSLPTIAKLKADIHKIGLAKSLFHSDRFIFLKTILQVASADVIGGAMWQTTFTLEDGTAKLRYRRNKAQAASIDGEHGDQPHASLPFKRDRRHERDGSASSPFLSSFRTIEEPPITFVAGRTTMAAERAYRLLIHIFSYGSFDSFAALDLTFCRWEELLEPPETGRTVKNISVKIFDAIEDLLLNKHCSDFKRILVVSEDKLRTPRAIQVLEAIHRREEEWRSKYGAAVIFTRVLEYPRRGSAARRPLRDEIADLSDFALFGHRNRGLALIEVGVKTPYDSVVVENSRFAIVINPQELADRQRRFLTLWDVSRPLGDFFISEVR